MTEPKKTTRRRTRCPIGSGSSDRVESLQTATARSSQKSGRGASKRLAARLPEPVAEQAPPEPNGSGACREASQRCRWNSCSSSWFKS